MTISKERITISTTSAVISLILGIGAIFAIFYNAKADASDRVNDISQRVTKLETSVPAIEEDIKDIKEAVKDVPTLVHLVKKAYPNY
jgi:hypothetical protein